MIGDRKDSKFDVQVKCANRRLRTTNRPWYGQVMWPINIFLAPVISLERLNLKSSNFVHRLIYINSRKGRGYGQVTVQNCAVCRDTARRAGSSATAELLVQFPLLWLGLNVWCHCQEYAIVAYFCIFLPHILHLFVPHIYKKIPRISDMPRWRAHTCIYLLAYFPWEPG